METGAIGYFLSVAAVIITLYWIYRGIRVGIYPALNMFLVFFLALLFTLNYYELLMPLIGKLAPKSSLTIRQSISFISMYLIVFTTFLYFCLWLCAETLRIHKSVDAVGGAILGLATGIVCTGVLLMMWYSIPFGESNFPVDDSEMFFPADHFALYGATAVGRTIPGAKSFDGIRFVRDVRYGLPKMETTTSGYYVSSIPAGLQVFVSMGGPGARNRRTHEFVTKIKEYLVQPHGGTDRRERVRAAGPKGRTPVFVSGGSARDAAMIAVVMDVSRMSIGAEAADPSSYFVNEGEIYYALEQVGDQKLFIKVYAVETEDTFGALVALFQPKDPARWDMVDTFLPLQRCFEFDDKVLRKEMMEQGATYDEADRLLPKLHLGGKVYFIGRVERPVVVQMTGRNRWRIFEPKQLTAEDIEAVKGARKGRRGPRR